MEGWSSLSDSIGKLGNYPLAYLEVTGWPTDDYGDDSLPSCERQYNNRGLLPVIQSELAKRDIFIGDRKIHWYGRGGSEVSSSSSKPLSERTDAMLANTTSSEYPQPGVRNTADTVICICGTNDTAAPTSDANFEADYKAEIDRWLAAGVTKIFVVEVYRDSTLAGDDPDRSSIVAGYNSIINDLETYDSNIHVVRLTNGYSTTDGIHPNAAGMVELGKVIANAIYVNL